MNHGLSFAAACLAALTVGVVTDPYLVLAEWDVPLLIAGAIPLAGVAARVPSVALGGLLGIVLSGLAALGLYDADPTVWVVLITSSGAASAAAWMVEEAHLLPISMRAYGSFLIGSAAAGAWAMIMAFLLGSPGPASWGLVAAGSLLLAAPALAALARGLPALPRAGPTREAGTQGGEAPRQRVLVVEDDPISRMVAQEMLRRAGWDAVTEGGGAAGAQRAVSEDFDVILMDLHMPEVDGIDAIRRIRGCPHFKRAAVPIILLTADVTREARTRAIAAGADASLAKPFEADVLCRALCEAIARRRSGIPAPTPVPEGGAWFDEEHDSLLLQKGLLDLDLLDERLEDLGAGSLSRIIGLYVASAPRQVAGIHRRLLDGDLERLRREAHTLKGASRVIGATIVADIARALEAQVVDPPEELHARVEALRARVLQSVEALKAYARRVELDLDLRGAEERRHQGEHLETPPV